MRRRDFLKCSSISALGLSLAKAKKGELFAFNPEELRKRLEEEARRIFELNRVNSALGQFHLPSHSSYPRFFAWDSGWNVISLSSLDPEAGILELETIFKGFQDGSGFVPHEALIPEFDKAKDLTYIWFGDKYFDQKGRCRIIDPPSFLLAGEVIYKKTKDRRILSLLPKMKKCLDYLTRERDLFGDGLISIIHPWEAGTDMAPVFDEALGVNINNPFEIVKLGKKFSNIISSYASDNWDLKKIAMRNEFIFEDLCINSLTAASAVSLSELFKSAGQPDEAEKCLSLAKNMVSAMEKICFDDKRGFFFPRFDLVQRKIAYRVSVPGMMPLLTGMVNEEIAQRVLNNYLLSPEQFWGDYLVPFNSITEMKNENTLFVRGFLWRGPCIWANMNWIVARLSVKYGRKDIARKITRNTALMIAKNGFREFYDPDTGSGKGAKDFTWPALVLNMIDEYGLE